MSSEKDFPGGLKRVTQGDCLLCNKVVYCAIGNLWYAFPTIDSVIWGEGKGCPSDWFQTFEEEKRADNISSDSPRPSTSV